VIFVDSGAWFAKFAQDDPDHLRVEDWFAANQEPLVTTDYYVDETLTLLVARRRAGAALLGGRQFFEQSIARLHFVTPDQIHRAWILFQGRHRSGWSFTDCTSKIVIDHPPGRTTSRRAIRGDFGVLVHDRKLKLGFFLAFALVPPPDDPAFEQYEERVKQFENVELDARELVPA
jgi:hypothetical protein